VSAAASNVIEMSPEDPEDAIDRELAKAKLEHGVGNVAAVQTAMGWALFRAPTVAETTRYKMLLADDKSKSAAGGILARLVVLYPARETFAEWCDAKPMTPEECMNTILELAGLTGKPAVKK